MNLKKLSKKTPEEILAAIKEENFNDESKSVLIGFELEKESPNSEVLDALGYVAPEEDDEPEIDEDGEVIEKMNMNKEFNMIIHEDGLKHYFQDGKVFDNATKVLLVDTNKKK